MTTATATPSAPTTRRCIGSKKFGIEAHEAPIGEFNAQPSQRDGLARMCKTDWSRYTRALRTGSTEPTPKAPSIESRSAAKRVATLKGEDPEAAAAAIPAAPAKPRRTVPAPEALPQTVAEVETPEGQQALADAATAAAEARKAAEREAARVRMANLRKARKEAAEAAKA